MGGTWDTAIMSGGRSSDTYSSEWISYEAAQCWWPEDPSYMAELGAVRFVSFAATTWSHATYKSYWRAPGQLAERLVNATELGAFRAADPIEATCAAGWHWQPPLPHSDAAAVLTCSANSQWVDVSIGGTRRCVRDRLDCPAPLVDAGYGECSDPLPTLESAVVYNAYLLDPIGRAVNVDAVTVTDCRGSTSRADIRTIFSW